MSDVAGKFWVHARDTGHQTLEVFVLDEAACQVFMDFVPSLSLDDADELLRSCGFGRTRDWHSGMPGSSWARARKTQVR